MSDQLEVLNGWGRTSATAARVTSLRGEDVPAFVASGSDRGVLARGLGRSYGDAAQNGGGRVLRLEASPCDLDVGAGTVTTSAGTTLKQLIDFLLPRGYFPMTTPGTRSITLGGAIACDVHGKNHHRDGSFGSHVLGLEIVSADAQPRWVGPDREPDVFWATVGGLGLTGVITRATMRVRRVETSMIRATRERVPNLETLVARMTELDKTATYSVAWLDLHAQGVEMGRAVLDHGEHANLDALTSRQAAAPLRIPSTRRVGWPGSVPTNLMNRPAVRAFNSAWYRLSPARPRTRVTPLSSFFYPLDAVRGWNRVYGPRGFVQYQFLVPDRATDHLAAIVGEVAASRRASFLNVLKRLGPANRGPLSFPSAGWTLAIDLAADPQIAGLLRRLDAMVLDAGGRLYLGKDGRLDAVTVRAMYPRLDDFLQVRRQLGASDVFCSDLARRLALEGDGTAS